MSMSKRFTSFVNDEDGFTIEDAITVVMILFFIISKIVHMYIIVKYSSIDSILEHYIVVMDDINAFTSIVILFYFGSSTFNSGAPRVVDTIKALKGINVNTEKKYSETVVSSIDENIIKESVEDLNIDSTIKEEPIISPEMVTGKSRIKIKNLEKGDDGIG